MTDQGPDHASGLQAVADRYGVSLDAVRHLLQALERGQGNMAQFDHPDLGGLGQWSAGGMIMVGDMFNNALKARVAGLCTELAAALPPGGWSAGGAPESRRGGGEWWPADLGRPASAGAQDGLRYAYFPQSRRLAVESGQGVAVYDTGAYQISGVSQANGALGFTGPQGTVQLDRLRRIEAEPDAAAREPAPEPGPAVATAASSTAFTAQGPAQAAPGPGSGGDILATIERLAELHARGVLTEQEFSRKKAELLARL